MSGGDVIDCAVYDVWDYLCIYGRGCWRDDVMPRWEVWRGWRLCNMFYNKEFAICTTRQVELGHEPPRPRYNDTLDNCINPANPLDHLESRIRATFIDLTLDQVGRMQKVILYCILLLHQ